jgi:hypothetical protein
MLSYKRKSNKQIIPVKPDGRFDAAVDSSEVDDDHDDEK